MKVEERVLWNKKILKRNSKEDTFSTVGLFELFISTCYAVHRTNLIEEGLSLLGEFICWKTDKSYWIE